MVGTTETNQYLHLATDFVLRDMNAEHQLSRDMRPDEKVGIATCPTW